MRRAAIVAMCALLLGACGYRPLYGTIEGDSSVAGALASISIPEPTTRVEQLIRNELVSTISPAGGDGGAYLLEIDAEGDEEPAVIAFNSDEIRKSVRLRAKFRLIDKVSGKVLYAAKTFSQVQYDRVGAPFADLQARTNAEERAAKEIGGDIRTRLAAHFATR